MAFAGLSTWLVSPIGQKQAGPEKGASTLDRLQAGERPELPPFELKTADGRSWSSRDAKGEVILLSFWATWCAPCRHELPAFQRLQAEYGSKGFQVVTVHVDSDPESQEEAKKLWSELRLDFIPYIDFARQLAGTLDVQSLPTNVLVDRKGRVILATVGERDWLSSESRNLLVEALSEPI